MAKADYDQFAGLHRLAEAARTIDQRAAVILTYHAALEREIDVVLERLLPQAKRLKRFGFGHKIDVLAAAWRGAPDAGDRLYDVLCRFNDLRNAVAHGDRADLIEGALTRLITAYRGIVSEAGEDIQVDQMAAGICGFMADGPTARRVSELALSLDTLVNETMPKAPRVAQSD